MKFYSTNNRTHQVSLRDAVIQGLAPDNGLYMPEVINPLPQSFFDHISTMSFQDIAYAVADNLMRGDVPEAELRRIVEHTLQFEAPLVPIEDQVYALELFHGPTMAFKDFGARFMSQLLGYFAQQQDREVTILVATSGDTGSAVANGFLGVPGTKVIVLYPSGKVSDVQEKQFTTLGQNITALEVAGTFDDCQRLVKQAFLDKDLRKKHFLTSANSINIARLIPQSFYYFYAYSRLPDRARPVVFSVSSGNFGNLTGGLFAQRMGLPVDRFIAATNINDSVPVYLRTAKFDPHPSRQTISNAMDVGNPSNFARMQDLFNGNHDALAAAIEGHVFTDHQTEEAMRNVYKASGYILDPHGAVGYLGLKKHLEQRKEPVHGIFLETAHPGKFLEVVESVLQTRAPLPPILQKFMSGSKQSVNMPNEFKALKTFLESI